MHMRFQQRQQKLGNRRPQLRLHLGVEVSQRSELALSLQDSTAAINKDHAGIFNSESDIKKVVCANRFFSANLQFLQKIFHIY